MLDDLGVISTINWFCREYRGTYDHIQIEKKITLDENEIIDSRKIVIYRIIQEALNNTAKHSGADLVYIKLHKLDADNFQLYISDNGCGIKNLENSSQNYNSIGLGGMQERAELTGGVFKISNNEPSGVLIDVRWPAN
jgi:signal transduction histidine kinase